MIIYTEYYVQNNLKFHKSKNKRGKKFKSYEKKILWMYSKIKTHTLYYHYVQEASCFQEKISITKDSVSEVNLTFRLQLNAMSPNSEILIGLEFLVWLEHVRVRVWVRFRVRARDFRMVRNLFP